MAGLGLFFGTGDWWIAIAVLVVIVSAFLLYLYFTSVSFPYEKIDSLCTKTELKFFHILDKAVGADFRIFGKTRIADLLKVRKGTKKRMSWQNRINCKHIDFVLCDPGDLTILVAIELDDESHQRPDRVKRDEFVNQAFQDAMLPILRIKTADKYDPNRIRKVIDQVLAPQNKNWVVHLE